MARWKDIPDSLDERVRQLVVQLRRLKDRSGLSLASLEAKTGYSRSSWERYLNGKTLPPRAAVEELARVAGTDPTRLLVLHEVAADAWRGGTEGVQPAGVAGAARSDAAADPVGGPDGASGPDGPAPRVRRAVLVGAGTAVVAAAALVGLLVAAPWEDGDGGTKSPARPWPAASAPARGAFAWHAGKSYPCAVKRKDGQLHAGYSTTRTAVLAGPSWDVVEAQCLLRYHGFDPGAADGAVGELTTRAVTRLQDKAGIEPDGIVGPDTWRVLRR